MNPRFLRLVLMRHASASAAAPGADDHTRALDARGRSEATAVAARLDALGWVPDEVVCSDSARTAETWATMEDLLRSGVTPTFRRGLYLAGWTGFCQHVGRATRPTVLALGHNPGFEEVCELLCGEAVALGTGDAALLQRSVVPWELALEPDAFSLIDVVRAKDLV